MRRAAAVVLGTVTGTALLIGAKLGNSSSGADATSNDASAVVVSGTTAAPAKTKAAAPTPAATGKKAATTKPKPPPAPSGPKDGTYHASAPVSGGDYGTVSMTVTIAGAKITNITATESGGETNCYSNACTKLKPAALQAQSANISSVSGATYSSSAYKAALQAILNSAKA
jgi:uncharacterized protein with FMN-binding domain